ncbi:MAG: hypothetical protein LBQ77_01720 [Treponema sp.]|nr:hypothetical protein [Treponema sp.]
MSSLFRDRPFGVSTCRRTSIKGDRPLCKDRLYQQGQTSLKRQTLSRGQTPEEDRLYQGDRPL